MNSGRIDGGQLIHLAFIWRQFFSATSLGKATTVCTQHCYTSPLLILQGIYISRDLLITYTFYIASYSYIANTTACTQQCYTSPFYMLLGSWLDLTFTQIFYMNRSYTKNVNTILELILMCAHSNAVLHPSSSYQGPGWILHMQRSSCLCLGVAPKI